MRALESSNALMLFFPAESVNKREVQAAFIPTSASKKKDEGWHPHAGLLPQRVLD